MRRKGWTDEENALLYELTDGARASGGSLSGAFRTIARATGRQPDSVRNRYYALLREKGVSTGSFTPFSPGEADELMEKMTALIGRGCSVRRAAFVLAKGDAKLMLRFQNKYRAMLKPAAASEKTSSRTPPEAEPDTAGYAQRLRDLNDTVKEQHERFMALHSMFTELCGINRELIKRLAAAEENGFTGAPGAADVT